MNKPKLAPCRCGGTAQYVELSNGARLKAECTRCRITTPEKVPGLYTSAAQDVADIWNAGSTMWPRWVKPSGAIDTYRLDDQVSHTTGEGGAWEHWISLMDNNVGEPGKANWRLVGPAPDEGWAAT